MNKRPVAFTEAAFEDIERAANWYNKESPDVVKDFLFSVEDMVSLISKFPELGPKVADNLRRILIQRFHYSIYYFAHPRAIVIVALEHDLRHPNRWKNRS